MVTSSAPGLNVDKLPFLQFYFFIFIILHVTWHNVCFLFFLNRVLLKDYLCLKEAEPRPWRPLVPVVVCCVSCFQQQTAKYFGKPCRLCTEAGAKGQRSDQDNYVSGNENTHTHTHTDSVSATVAGPVQVALRPLQEKDRQTVGKTDDGSLKIHLDDSDETFCGG